MNPVILMNYLAGHYPILLNIKIQPEAAILQIWNYGQTTTIYSKFYK